MSEYVCDWKVYGKLPAWKKNFFYCILYKDGRKRRGYHLDDVVEQFRNDDDAIKLYAYTKDLFPFKCLIMWK